MTYQNPFQYYDDTANADESSSLFLTATDASPSSVLRQEEAVAMKKKLLTALAVGVATGILLLVVAGDYSVVVAPAAAANGGSTETIVELPVGGDKFGTCYTPEGTFQGWSCDNAHGPYRDGCIDNIGHFKPKDGAFETCFGLGSPNGSRCWSKSRYVYVNDWLGTDGWFPCVPRDLGVHGNPPEHWYVAQPISNGSCGEPCHYGFNERNIYPLHNIGDHDAFDDDGWLR